jgi:CRP-like cAMP-binding protein
MVELKDRVIYLNKIHLFNGLREEQLSGIGAKLQERELKAGQVVFKRGEKPDGFYLIYKGKVKVTRPSDKEGGEDFLAWLTGGDYFGEEALFEKRNRSASITVVEDCILFFLTREGFDDLLTRYEKLKPNFLVAIKSRKLARATKFKWLGPKEVIYFIARRHKLLLYQALIVPILAQIFPIGLIVWGLLVGAVSPVAVGVLVMVALLAWAVWNAIDWSNDYYIVTNQRVIWLEKVIGIYDSREEAPLSTILSVGVETDVLGRALDFGNVIVRTFVGKLEFDHVDHPAQAADMIREYWERTKAITNVSQQDVMKNTIRQKLGLPVEKKKLDDLPPVVIEDKAIAQKSFWLLALSNLFKLRVEDGGTITYHKHWIILLQQAWRPLGLTLVIIGAVIARIWFLASSPERAFLELNAAGSFSPDALVMTLLFFMLPAIGWLVWEYVDWKNDIFMVTPDEIFDIDRRPLGKEERRAAQIENILSTTYKRNGFIAFLFNYGTVNITVGGTQLDFQDVLDPAGVQADINRRRMARIARKNEDAGSADRERFANWLVAYHKNVNDFNAPVKTEGREPVMVTVKKNEDELDGDMIEIDDEDLGLDMDGDDGSGAGGDSSGGMEAWS